MKKLFPIFLILIASLFITTKPAQASGLMDIMGQGFLVLTWGCDGMANTRFREAQTSCTSDSVSLETWIKGKNTDTISTSYNTNTKDYGAVGATTRLITSTFNPPASSGYYVADLLKNSHILATPAYAQEGLGFSALTPILPIWKIFRNMSYFFFVLIFLAIGFAIMFRAKLNPQTVISIESALPKLIVTLILITFSYAIAGLLIDIMYIAIYLATNLFQASRLLPSSKNLETIALRDNIFSNSFGFMGAGWEAAKSVGETINNLIDTFFVGELLGGLATLLTTIVLSVAILIGMFRTFFMLLSTYIQVVLAIIFAPVQIMLNALPGSNSFTSWLRNLVANLAVFPVVIIIIFLGYGLTNQPHGGSGGFLPPQIPGVGTTGAIQALIGIGIIMLLPEAAKAVKEALGVKESPLGQAVLGNVGKGTIPARRALSGYQESLAAQRQTRELAKALGAPPPAISKKNAFVEGLLRAFYIDKLISRK